MKLKITQIRVWLDSQRVLYWIDSNKSLSTLVENRVKEIKEEKNISFHYISTKENTADIASRFASTSERHQNP